MRSYALPAEGKMEATQTRTVVSHPWITLEAFQKAYKLSSKGYLRTRCLSGEVNEIKIGAQYYYKVRDCLVHGGLSLEQMQEAMGGVTSKTVFSRVSQGLVAFSEDANRRLFRMVAAGELLEPEELRLAAAPGMEEIEHEGATYFRPFSVVISS